MEDSDDEWEEQYVFVELIGMVDPDKLTSITTENTAILVSSFSNFNINYASS